LAAARGIKACRLLIGGIRIPVPLLPRQCIAEEAMQIRVERAEADCLPECRLSLRIPALCKQRDGKAAVTACGCAG
jgi:hypothetical protein